ncbi:hypothetical protein NMG60_11022468 [Bertholletia excelsa]
MSVVGFDVGNENCVIAAVKQRGIDILLNEESKRETPAVVSFGEKQRLLGSAGAACATMNPKLTIAQVKRLIGRKFKEPSVQDDIRLFPFQTSEGPDGGILVHLPYLGQTHNFTPIQILAMLLAHLKQIAEKNLEAPVLDCVIGIPSYFTDLQRRAYLHAAEIAGLKPLRLMHDCTSTALGYGIYKSDFHNAGPTYVVFVDIGHCDTQVAVASFEHGQMKILSHAFDGNLGGRDFDQVLFRYFAAQFKEQYNIDVYSSPRASIRLRASCEKLKKVLSANVEAPLNIECLMDEKDVKGFIKREDFEKLSLDLLERISIPCRKALDDSGLTVDKIHTVELVGSGSRIPSITKIVASIFRKEPGRTLNASECVARGCALQCAMLSPVFRVRDYEVQDSFPFSIGFLSDEGPISTLSNSTLFPKGHPFPSVKMLTLHRSNTFHMEAFYSDHNELPPGMSPKISNFTIGPFHVSDADKVKIKVRVQLNIHGIVTIESASLIEDFKHDSMGNAQVTSEKMEINNQASADTVNGLEDTNSVGADGTKKGKGMRRRYLQVHENLYGGMTKDELSQAQEKELQMAQQDIKVELAKDKKNTLEAYVYETRSKLLDSYRSFATEAEKEALSRNLQQTEEWLYEDGNDESENAYTDKLEDLKKLLDPIENRYKDEEARAQAMKGLLNCIMDYRKTAGSLPSTERDAVINECSKAEQWLLEKTQQQESWPKNADPILWSSEIKRKLDALDAMCKHITRSRVSAPGPGDATESDHRNRHDDVD